MSLFRVLISLAMTTVFQSVLLGQPASIQEENLSLLTYPFSDPSPVPVLTTNPKIYPYHLFQGYSHQGTKKQWKVVRLENKYIKVWVMPEVGGKVWGAVEKVSGEEFIYRNEVMKFRNISMRGPWTSGGIEFNFGLIGHAPSTATPVDYVIQQHEDGSVSCTVGAIDLPSRTQWRVQISLAPDKAYFVTRSLWYNPTPLEHPYYNWMTAAARASEDLEFFYPGHVSLEHSGEARPWPRDEKGRQLSLYRQNNFGSSKSYHVAGAYQDFFGGYWHDKKFGFGHWSRYEEMPGQKLWIWALSRSGGIWEDLLTDTDGQYIEFQAGRLLNQFSPATQDNSISEVAFQPYVTDRWTERWFPVKETGGISSVSAQAALHILQKNDSTLTLTLNALQPVQDTLILSVQGERVQQKALQMEPMAVYAMDFTTPSAEAEYTIFLGQEELYSSREEKKRQLDRPFANEQPFALKPAEQLYRQATELVNTRAYQQALEKLLECLEKDAAHLQARIALASLYYRLTDYQQALEHILLALAADTYHADANYTAGLVYHALGEQVNALEALGWAARSMQYRSAAYTQMAHIHMERKNLEEAASYARQALDYNRYNVSASQLLAVAYRLSGKQKEAEDIQAALLEIDPLNHLARFERYRSSGKETELQAFSSMIRNEMPYQTYLELAMNYLAMARTEDALSVLQQSPSHALVDLWRAYLIRTDTSSSNTLLRQGLAQSPDFVFPYRQESLQMLEWVDRHSEDWKSSYYLGLLYWSLHRSEEAASLWEKIGDQPGYAPFYIARAELLRQSKGKNPLPDLQKALACDSSQWRSWHQLLQSLGEQQLYDKQLAYAQKAYSRFGENYIIGMDYAQSLLNNGQYEDCIALLDQINVLPYEGAYEGRRVYEQAHLLSALQNMQDKKWHQAVRRVETSLLWPENLGVGKPYGPDTRKQDLLMASIYEKLKKPAMAQKLLNRVAANAKDLQGNVSYQDVLGIVALQKLDRTEDLQQLMQQIDKSNASPNEVSKWIMTYWQNEKEALHQLEEKEKSSSDANLKLLSEILQALTRL